MVRVFFWHADRSCSSPSSIRFLIISPKLVSWSNVVSLRWLVFFPPSSWDNLPISAMTRSSGVTPGFVRYLCLWKKIPEILVAFDFFIHIVQAQKCSNEVPKTCPLLQCLEFFFCGADFRGLTFSFLLVKWMCTVVVLAVHMRVR